MTLESLTTVAEIVSAVAIVATLAYVAVQTKQTSRALNANSRAQMLSADLQIVMQWANAPVTQSTRNFAQSWSPGLELTDERVSELLRDLNLLIAMLRVREFAWFQYQDGLLDQRAWRGYAATLERTLRQGSNLDHWEKVKSELDPEFVAFMDERLTAQ